VAAIYDIHGNLPALDAVLAEIEAVKPDLIVVGGDLATGPMPRETMDRLMSLDGSARFIRGNSDREVVSHWDGLEPERDDPFADVTAWSAERLTRDQRDFLAGLPEQLDVEIEGLGSVLFCHGSPRSDEEMITPGTSDIRLHAMLGGMQHKVVVCGHTHMQFDRTIGGMRVINAGSVGMPYEGEPGAYWVLLGPEVQLKRTMYDVESTAQTVLQSDFPGAEEFAEENILHPLSPATVTEIFEKQAAAQESDQ
jgi:putative phosphoesterase